MSVTDPTLKNENHVFGVIYMFLWYFFLMIGEVKSRLYFFYFFVEIINREQLKDSV